jgi:hypothetical protein
VRETSETLDDVAVVLGVLRVSRPEATRQIDGALLIGERFGVTEG